MKMKHISANILIQACLFFTLTSCNTTTSSSDDETQLSSWMSILDDTTRVCKVSIPGTHDSLTGEGFTDSTYVNDYTTQVATFDQQLNGGLRYFDIRLVMQDVSGNTILQTSHRTATIKLTFDDVLKKTKMFLSKNPTEFLILKIQYDGGTMSPEEKNKWTTTVQSTLADSDYSCLFVPFRPDLRVKDMRGKILLISRTDYGSPVVGALTNWIDEGTEEYIRIDSIAERKLVIAPDRKAATPYMGAGDKNAARLFVQDFYNSIGSRIDAKLYAVEAMFHSSLSVPDADNIWIINHTSGFSTPKMNAIGYAENASKTNAKLLSLLANDNSTQGLGIVAMDYACIDTLHRAIGTLGEIDRAVLSRSLTRAIIDRNKRK